MLQTIQYHNMIFFEIVSLKKRQLQAVKCMYKPKLILKQESLGLENLDLRKDVGKIPKNDEKCIEL